jgi:phage terminase large subunit GpA-like protein
MFDGLAEIQAAWRAGIKPEPLLTVSEWADAHRMLSSKGSAEPGPWRNSRTPYLAEIMDCLSPSHPAQRVVFMKGAQVGATESGNNWIGYIIQHAPGPMLAVQPTVELAKRFSRQRIEPLLEETPALRGLVAAARERDSGNTMLSKDFAGGQLVLTGANSAVGLRSMSARYLFLDEVDAYPGDVEGEGDPIALASARARTFGRRKKEYLVSTPTIAGASRIEREYEASDQRRFFLPCPHCQSMQWLQFERLIWTKGAPETAAYVCEDCETPIPERHKTWMLAHGEWRATAETQNAATVGFHISSLYSPVGWLSWEQIARDWEAAQGKDQALKTFKNTVLGEVWQERGEAPDWQRLYDRREEWPVATVPQGGLFLTAGADVQRDRIEVSVWAWGYDRQSWLIDHRVLVGNPFERAVWLELRALLDTQWHHASGRPMGLAMTAIDSGDGMTTAEVYTFAKASASARVIAIKGMDSLRQAIGNPSDAEIKRGGKTMGGFKVWPVGSSFLKGETYGWLKLDPPTTESGADYPAGYVHLSRHAAGEEYCRQLTAEQHVARVGKNGFRRLEWVKTRERNEALDCRVYARAAAVAHGAESMTPGQWFALAAARSGEAAAAAVQAHWPAKAETPRAEPAPAAPPPVAASAMRGRTVQGSGRRVF